MPLLCFDDRLPADQCANSRASGKRTAVLVLWVGLLLGGMAARGLAQTAAQTTLTSVIEAIKIEPTTSDRIEVWIFAGADLDLIGVRVDQDDLLALQIPQHVPGPNVEDLFPSDGLIEALRSKLEQTPRGPLTRITIRLRHPTAYDLSADKGRLRLRLWPRGGESAEDALRRQVTGLEAALTASENARDDLAKRLENMEQGQRSLDTSLTSTLAEVTEVLRGLRAKTEELTHQVRQASSRESELSEQITQLEASLAEFERARTELAAAVSARAPTLRTPTVQLGNASADGLEATPAIPSPVSEDVLSGSGSNAEVAEGYRFIVAASSPEQRAATELAADLRGRGYASEVYWSDSGFYVVTLGPLPRIEAQRVRDHAVRRGDVAKDAYLIYGTSLQSKVDP